jgi:putative flippase GtrA
MVKNLIKKFISSKVIKYAFWWWIAALIDLFSLYIFVDIFHIYYILWAILAFCVSFLFWFFYQKYITFSNYDKKHISQWILFLVFQLIWLWINILLLYILVDKFLFYYMYVAILNKFIVFVWNYVMNNYFNFK